MPEIRNRDQPSSNAQAVRRTIWYMTRPQCWLRTNVRAMLLGTVLPGIALLVGISLGCGLTGTAGIIRGVGWVLAVAAAAVLAAIVGSLRVPRLAYEDGFLLVYLRRRRPIRLPVELVECFFLGQTSTRLPRPGGGDAAASAVVVRLAQRAKDWHHVDVKPTLGQWCDGYITIRGTWCEPLSFELVNHLNDRLAEVKRSL